MLRGLSLVGLNVAERLITKGQASVNLVAAVPSLHAAYAALVAATLWPTARRVTRGLLVAYVLGMAFALVVSGEHYVIDALLGWGYVAGATVGWDRLQPWWGG